MDNQQAKIILENWLAEETLLDVPLLETKPDGVTPILRGSSDKRKLSCSTALVNLVRNLGNEIIQDWSDGRSMEGVSYFIYCRNETNQFDPLYVGVASSSNKNKDKCSVLWSNRGGRFSDVYGSNGHVDCLSRALFKSYKGYADWIPALFEPVSAGRSSTERSLLRPVYVHLEKWNGAARRMFPAAANVPLFLEEMLRLWIFRQAGVGSKLLNRIGT